MTENTFVAFYTSLSETQKRALASALHIASMIWEADFWLAARHEDHASAHAVSAATCCVGLVLAFPGGIASLKRVFAFALGKGFITLPPRFTSLQEAYACMVNIQNVKHTQDTAA